MALRFPHRRFPRLVLGLVLLAFARDAHAEKLKVVVPEKDNLQYLAFWFAKAGGFFEREGIDIELVIAPAAGPKGTPPIDGMLDAGEADAAVLAPAVYLRMIGAKSPIVLVANLFKNDGYALVVRRDVVDGRKVSADTAMRERLTALKGLRIGYPPASFGRLRTLLSSQGLDAENDIKGQVLLSRDQAVAFRDKALDAAYLATPSLEKFVVLGDGVVIVNQARGEVTELANRQTHVFAVSRRVLDARRAVVISAVRAIAAAERRIHAAQPEVVDALARELPARDRPELEAIVGLYEPGVPESADVRAEDIAASLALIPEGVPKPELAGIDLASFVAPEIARAAARPESSGRSSWIALAAGVLAIVAMVLVVRRRRAGRATARPTASDD